MSFNSPPRAKKVFNQQVFERPERPRPVNKRNPNAHLSKNRVNEFGIQIPSEDIENYVPGLNDNVEYIMNNFRGRNTVKAYAKRQMNAAKLRYKQERNLRMNNANRMNNSSWTAKRAKTQRKRKTRKSKR